MQQERHILVVLPHPDDESFGISGTLAKQIKEYGTPVTYACLTLGEMGRNMGNPLFANRETLPAIRKQELEQSCAAIGIQDLRLMGLYDKTVEFEDQEMIIARLNTIIDEVNPSLVFTFYPGYSVHPDHDATGDFVVKTIERLPEERRPKVYCVAFAKGCEIALGAPDVLHDVTPYLPQKMASLAAHKSQFQMAAILQGKSMQDKELLDRFGKERFWTYKFN